MLIHNYREKMINHIYFIVHQENEPERYSSILNIIEKNGLTNYTISKQLWADDITKEMYQDSCKSNRALLFYCGSNSKRILSNGEVSLFLNHMSYLKQIRDNYTDGYFIIFESDVLFHDDFKVKLEKVLELAEKNDDWDIINIGSGNGYDLPGKWNRDNKILPGLNLYKEARNRGTDGIIWKYSAICKFVDYVQDIDAPIDAKMDFFSEFDGGFNIYWAHPALVYQGSVCGKFKSYLRTY
jgi:GR25 family glycosyltransferase involved in LPS biosynthesis